MFSQRRNRETISSNDPETPLGLYLGVDFDISEARYSWKEPWLTRKAEGKVNEADLMALMNPQLNVAIETVIEQREVKLGRIKSYCFLFMSNSLGSHRLRSLVTGLRTIVVQSFRTHDVPEWIGRCVASVQKWTASEHFEYRMMGDELFNLVPDWYRAKAGRHVTVVTDLARLVLIRRFLDEGFGRVIWIDADVIVFDPSALKINLDCSYAYCREIWVKRNSRAGLITAHKVNNSACLFLNDSAALAHLDEYIDTCKSMIVRLTKVRDHTEVGTKFLTSLNRERPLHFIPGFGLLSPTILRAVLDCDRGVLSEFVQLQGDTIGAANLCNFLRGSEAGVTDEMFSAVIDRLVDSGVSLFSGPFSVGR